MTNLKEKNLLVSLKDFISRHSQEDNVNPFNS